MGILEKKIVPVFKVFSTPFFGNICLSAFNNFMIFWYEYGYGFTETRVGFERSEYGNGTGTG